MGRLHKKIEVERTCYELTRERLAYVFDRFDRVVVAFSGGKDSTVCLNLALETAREANKLPLIVNSFDEEAIPPETVEYLARVAALPDVDFRWYCVPIEHRNACSASEPHWYPWAPEDRHRWVRDLPPLAITEFAGFRRAGIGDQIPVLFPPSEGTVANIIGIRSQESMSRFIAVASKKGETAYMTQQGSEFKAAKHITNVYAIYDWQTEDVWRAPHLFGWDYNRSYDVMDQAGIPRHAQRCAPPFGEQPIRGLHRFKTCWPDLWAKMVDRVQGAATAARYANTELYGFHISDDDLPPGMTWRKLTMQSMAQLEGPSKQEVAQAIHSCIRFHDKYTSDPVPDDQPHPLTGFCWKTMYIAAKVGSNKHDRQMQKMFAKARTERIRNGLTY